jgi:hypothetical protein
MKKKLSAFILALLFAGNCLGQISLLECHNKGWPTDLSEAYQILYKTNCEFQEYLACGSGVNIFIPQVLVAVIDNETCEPWSSPGIDPITGSPVFQQNQFGQLNANNSCGRTRPEKLFYWNQTNPTSMSSLSNFIDNVVPDSSYLLIYTWIVSPNNPYGYPTPGTFSPWQSDILTAFHNLNFTQIDSIPLSHPWIFLTKKGAPETNRLVVGNTPDASIDLSAIICHPTPIISVSSTVLCEGGVSVLIAPPFLPGYLWSTGETTQVITISEPGYYTVTINLNDSAPVTSDSVTNCFYTDSIYIEAISCTGIEDPSTTLRMTFEVSPNPAKENINIIFNKPFSKQTLLNIYNVLGILNIGIGT